MTEKEQLSYQQDTLNDLKYFKCAGTSFGAYCDEPVSCPESSICLGWIVQYFLYVVAVV